MLRAAGSPWYRVATIVGIAVGLVASMNLGLVSTTSPLARGVSSVVSGVPSVVTDGTAPLAMTAGVRTDGVHVAGGTPAAPTSSLLLLNDSLTTGLPTTPVLSEATSELADPVDGVYIITGFCGLYTRANYCVETLAGSPPTPLGAFEIANCSSEFPYAQGSVVDPVTGLLYVGCSDGSVAVVDPISGAAITRIPPPAPTEFLPGCPNIGPGNPDTPIVGMAIDSIDSELFVFGINSCNVLGGDVANASLEAVSLGTDLPVWNFSFQTPFEYSSYFDTEPLAFDLTTDQLIVSTALNGSYQNVAAAVDATAPGFVGETPLVSLIGDVDPLAFLPSTGAVYAASLTTNVPDNPSALADQVLRLNPTTGSTTVVGEQVAVPSVTPLPVGQWIASAGLGGSSLVVSGRWIFDENATNEALAPATLDAVWVDNVSVGTATAAVGLPGDGIQTVPVAGSAASLYLDDTDVAVADVSVSPLSVGPAVPLAPMPNLVAVASAGGSVWLPIANGCTADSLADCLNASLVEVSGVSDHVERTVRTPVGIPLGIGVDSATGDLFEISSCVASSEPSICPNETTGDVEVFAPSGQLVQQAQVPSLSRVGALGTMIYDANASVMLLGVNQLRGGGDLLAVFTADPNVSAVFTLPLPRGELYCASEPELAYDGVDGIVFASAECANDTRATAELWALNASSLATEYVEPFPVWGPLAFDPTTDRLFAPTGPGIDVVVPQNGTIEATVAVPGGSDEVTDDAATGTLYSLGLNLTAINASSLVVTPLVALGNTTSFYLDDIAVDPVGGTIYLTDPSFGAVVIVAAPGPPTYAVAFPVEGLTAGVPWTVTVAGIPERGLGTLAFPLRDGTYTYSIGAVPGFRLIGASVRTVVVDGANVTAPPVEFLPNLYTVDFDGSGGSWTVALAGPDGTVPVTACGTTPGVGVSSCLVTNGTYRYLISGGAGWVVTGAPASGTVTVAGASTSIDFALVRGTTVSLTLHESGLPAGTRWCATVGGAAVVCSTTATAGVENLTPATYSFAIGGVPGFAPRVAAGEVALSHDRSVAVAFHVATSLLTFTEAGLATHHRWSIVVDGRTYATHGVGIQLAVPNGTVDYRVPPIPGYLGGVTGSVTISGVARAISIGFTRVTYRVTITETGLTAGTGWSVEIDGAYASSNGSTLSLEEPNGSYAIRVVAQPGFTASVTPSTVHVRGAGAAAAIVFRPRSLGGDPFSGFESDPRAARSDAFRPA